MRTIKNTHQARDEYKKDAGVIDATNIVLTINQMMMLIQDRKAIAIDMGDGRTVFVSTKIPDEDNFTDAVIVHSKDNLYANGKQVFEVDGLPNVEAEPKTEPRNDDVKPQRKPAPRKRK